MDLKDLSKRCQSCGMPLETGERSDKSFMGTNADGTFNREYCKFCWSLGGFTEPQLTVDDMMKKSASFMHRVLKFPEDKAKEVSGAVIPKLKRWRKDEP